MLGQIEQEWFEANFWQPAGNSLIDRSPWSMPSGQRDLGCCRRDELQNDSGKVSQLSVKLPRLHRLRC